jgi:hypothetical protein
VESADSTSETHPRRNFAKASGFALASELHRDSSRSFLPCHDLPNKIVVRPLDVRDPDGIERDFAAHGNQMAA